MVLIEEYLKYIAWFVWTSFTLFSITILFGSRYRTVLSARKGEARIVVVTIASSRVRNSLLQTVRSLRAGGYVFDILTDEGAELIDELVDMGYNVVVVPRSYRRDLVGKGRAINYYIENHVEPDKWYAFIDDDNIIMDDSFLYEIPYYEQMGYVACNPVLKPRLGRSKISFVMDWIRYVDDIGVFRFFTGILGSPLVGMHGELLCVKGSVLKEIGFDFHSITEDFRFAGELVRHGYRTWQSRTVVSIRSPNSIGDLLRQRGRWFKGVFIDVFTSNIPLKMRSIVMLRLVVWILGVFGSWLLSPLWILWGSYHIALPGAIVYWATYIYGSMRLGDLRYALLSPLYGIVESASWLYALRQRGFVVIDKN